LSKQDTSVPENASTSTSSCQIDLWKWWYPVKNYAAWYILIIGCFNLNAKGNYDSKFLYIIKLKTTYI
jgi:hypothetical protein